MFVDADAVVTELLRVLEFVEVNVVQLVSLHGIVERTGNVDPDGPVFLAEIVGEVRPRHQVEPRELHSITPFMRSPNDAKEGMSPALRTRVNNLS
jgi:hypothetical protein